MATVWAKLGKHHEASAEYMQAIQLDPQNPNFRLQAGIFFCTISAPFQALPHLEAGAKLAPKSAEIHSWLAQTYAMTGRLDDAQREAEKAVQLNPRDSRILCTAGVIFATANRRPEAERYYQESIQQNPMFVNAYVGLAQLYWFGGQAPQYRHTMQRLAQINPAAAEQLEQQLQMMRHMAPAPGTWAEESNRGSSGWLPDWTKLFGG